MNAKHLELVQELIAREANPKLAAYVVARKRIDDEWFRELFSAAMRGWGGDNYPSRKMINSERALNAVLRGRGLILGGMA